MNDVDFPVARVLEGIDAAAAAGLAPIKINMVVKRGVNEQRDRADGAALPRQRPHPALHRIHGRRRTPTAGAWTTSCRRPRSSRIDRRELPLEPRRPELRRRSRGALALPRRQRRDRRHRVGDAGLLPRLHARAACPPTASSTPACSPPTGYDLRALLRGGATDDADRQRDRRDLARARRPLLGDPHRRTRARLPKVEMSYIGG